jgi:DNA-binding IclR family transcriptional regulator
MEHVSVRTIARAVDILNALSANVNSISALTRQLKLSKSTVHRLLNALKESGLVMQDSLDHQYYLGHLLIKLAANPFTAHQHLIHCAYEKMKYLRDISEESVTLHIRLGIQRIRLNELTGTHDVRYMGRPTSTDPLWVGSVGKVLLAQIPEDELAVILDNIELVALTPNTITDKRKFRKEIEKVNNQGYATSYGETVVGVSSISVPVKDYVEPVALSILGPEFRFASPMLKFVNELKNSANQISQDFLKAKKQHTIIRSETEASSLERHADKKVKKDGGYIANNPLNSRLRNKPRAIPRR